MLRQLTRPVEADAVKRRVGAVQRDPR
jgi:hypothetical protein